VVFAAALLLALPAAAFDYVADEKGTFWGIQSSASPHVDTGSIRATQVGAGLGQALSTTINGFGGIKVKVLQQSPARGGLEQPVSRFNGELMRGFGLVFDGVDRFDSTKSIDLGGVTISRAVRIDRPGGYGRWVDTFTNTTSLPITIEIAFGGQSGIGPSGNNSSAIYTTSSGDSTIDLSDTWVAVATPLSGSTLVGGPQVTVLGSPDGVGRSLRFVGSWLHESFDNPIVYSGHEGNFQAYVHRLTLVPGRSCSLMHFVVLGPRVNSASSGATRAAVETTAARLSATPDLAGLTPAHICSIVNFDPSSLSAAGFAQRTCADRTLAKVPQPSAPAPRDSVTSVRYDVVGKSIGQLRADMEAGITTSEEITRAYLDRVSFYDRGQFGFNSFQIVAADAIEQAKAADAARRAGRSSPVLGIPVVVKNNFDTKDMATNNGSLTFDGFVPRRDAFQVARLREAGAVIIGKSALEEYATSGHYSNDAYGQVWNVFSPSRSPLASSGGSASAVAASMAAAALGSQTGDSLYAPASAASLVTLRGTDGLQSGTGIMPLVWLTDFGGAMTRSVSDLADMLNVIAGTDPEDPSTALADSKIPADWRSMLDPDALRGARIGFIPAVWVDPFGTTNTTDAMIAALRFLEEAGATIVEMGATVGGTNTPPVPPDNTTGNLTQEGWMQYIDSHPELIDQGFRIFSFVDVDCSQKKVPYVRAAPSACSATPAPRMTQAQIDAKRAQRVLRQQSTKAWMDAAGVDAIVYPGLLSDISLNDGGGPRAAFGRRDTPGGANGVPTIIVPAGLDSRGNPVAIQLFGRAWDDAKLVGYAYAFERLANAAGSGHVVPATTPPLQFRSAPSGR
jgi:amidase